MIQLRFIEQVRGKACQNYALSHYYFLHQIVIAYAAI
ncbi:unnamed protein product [Blumeria hordei]|uniref:Uncharacterized protein n=1 Tax=Blumeria hordei TaxID=2867405 RepID=A0A383UQ56_BLUHO|nr:unnamed protein product [Blumeria hordei]